MSYTNAEVLMFMLFTSTQKDLLCIYLLLSLTDVDECAEANNGGCTHGCIDTDGSYYCFCHDGYYLADNNHDCLGRNLIATIAHRQTSK